MIVSLYIYLYLILITFYQSLTTFYATFTIIIALTGLKETKENPLHGLQLFDLKLHRIEALSFDQRILILSLNR